MKSLDERTPFEVAELAALPVRDRCAFVLDEFEQWLAVRVLRLKLRHEELPILNDAFRDYFASTRSARTPGGSL